MVEVAQPPQPRTLAELDRVPTSTPTAADIDDAAPDFSSFPAAIIGLIVLEADVQRHRDTDRSEWRDRDAAIKPALSAPQEQERDNDTPDKENDQLPKCEVHNDVPTNIPASVHGFVESFPRRCRQRNPGRGAIPFNYRAFTPVRILVSNLRRLERQSRLDSCFRRTRETTRRSPFRQASRNGLAAPWLRTALPRRLPLLEPCPFS
jgi:hypothetical protein